MVDEQLFKDWLISEKCKSIIEASQLAEESQLPFPSEECKDLEFQFEIYIKTKLNELIAFKISEVEKKELQRIAKENNIKLSLVIRNAVQDFIEDYHKFERRLMNEERNREEINRQGNIQKNSSKH